MGRKEKGKANGDNKRRWSSYFSEVMGGSEGGAEVKTEEP